MVKIMADSTCDLSQELIEKYDITILPLHIVLGDREYADGTGVSPDDIYKWSDQHNSTPKTSACALEEVVDALRPYAEKAQEVVCFCISSAMSTTANVMRLAAKELGAEDKVFVVDTGNLSTGVGTLAVHGAEMALKGSTGAEIAASCEDKKPRVRTSFVVDTLKYLHRGGRCSSVAAMAGSVLKLHPKIAVIDGKMLAEKKYRGKMDSVLMEYAKDLEPDLIRAETDRIFITHSGCPESTINMVKDYIESLGRFKNIYVTRAGGVISSHCGPGTLGLLFIEGRKD